MIEVVEYNDEYEKDVKSLLVELQKYLSSLDNEKIRILTDDFEEEYFKHIKNITFAHEGKMFLAISNQKVMGVVIGFVDEETIEEKLRTTCPKMGKISKLVVREGVRGCGIGQKLMNQMEEYLKNVGCEYINLDVFAPNTTALNLYQKNGYNLRVHNALKKVS